MRAPSLPVCSLLSVSRTPAEVCVLTEPFLFSVPNEAPSAAPRAPALLDAHTAARAPPLGRARRSSSSAALMRV